MKRTHYPYPAKRIFPLFEWVLCDKCKREFRREGGWQAWLGSFNTGLCGECAPTERDANEYFCERSGRTMPPPPAPKGHAVVTTREVFRCADYPKCKGCPLRDPLQCDGIQWSKKYRLIAEEVANDVD